MPAETVVTPTPPANPYRFITWSKRDTPKTIDQIRRHNVRHAKMKAQASKGGE